MENKKKRNSEKKEGLVLMLILPISLFILFVVTFFNSTHGVGEMSWIGNDGESHYSGEGNLLVDIMYGVETVGWIGVVIGAILFIPGIIAFIRGNSKEK